MKRICLAAGVCAAGLGLAASLSAVAAQGAALGRGAAFGVGRRGIGRGVFGGRGHCRRRVDGGEIGVSGVSAGNTEIAIQTASGELQVPVQVGKGG